MVNDKNGCDFTTQATKSDYTPFVLHTTEKMGSVDGKQIHLGK